MIKLKEQAYHDLISKMKLDSRFPEKLANPHHLLTGIEKKYVDPWEQWQQDLDAEIMIIGQDFANENTFVQDDGLIEPADDKREKPFRYETNKRLSFLMGEYLFDIGHPHLNSDNRKQAPVFITNAVMGLKKTGSMSSPIKKIWIWYYRDQYLKPLIELINPKIIITIGRHPTYSVLSIYGIKFNSFAGIITEPPEKIKTNGIKIFPVAHTGGLGNVFRKREVTRCRLGKNRKMVQRE